MRTSSSHGGIDTQISFKGGHEVKYNIAYYVMAKYPKLGFLYQQFTHTCFKCGHAARQTQAIKWTHFCFKQGQLDGGFDAF